MDVNKDQKYKDKDFVSRTRTRTRTVNLKSTRTRTLYAGLGQGQGLGQGLPFCKTFKMSSVTRHNFQSIILYSDCATGLYRGLWDTGDCTGDVWTKKLHFISNAIENNTM